MVIINDVYRLFVINDIFIKLFNIKMCNISFMKIKHNFSFLIKRKNR